MALLKRSPLLYLGRYSRDGGASASWFGRQRSSDTLRGSCISFLLCLAGIAVINQICRGNLMGYCTNESDIFMPFSRTKVPLPDSYGFVDPAIEGRNEAVQGR